MPCVCVAAEASRPRHPGVGARDQRSGISMKSGVFKTQLTPWVLSPLAEGAARDTESPDTSSVRQTGHGVLQ